MKELHRSRRIRGNDTCHRCLGDCVDVLVDTESPVIVPCCVECFMFLNKDEPEYTKNTHKDLSQPSQGSKRTFRNESSDIEYHGGLQDW